MYGTKYPCSQCSRPQGVEFYFIFCENPVTKQCLNCLGWVAPISLWGQCLGRAELRDRGAVGDTPWPPVLCCALPCSGCALHSQHPEVARERCRCWNPRERCWMVPTWAWKEFMGHGGSLTFTLWALSVSTAMLWAINNNGMVELGRNRCLLKAHFCLPHTPFQHSSVFIE